MKKLILVVVVMFIFSLNSAIAMADSGDYKVRNFFSMSKMTTEVQRGILRQRVVMSILEMKIIKGSLMRESSLSVKEQAAFCRVQSSLEIFLELLNDNSMSRKERLAIAGGERRRLKKSLEEIRKILKRRGYEK